MLKVVVLRRGSCTAVAFIWGQERLSNTQEVLAEQRVKPGAYLDSFSCWSVGRCLEASREGEWTYKRTGRTERDFECVSCCHDEVLWCCDCNIEPCLVSPWCNECYTGRMVNSPRFWTKDIDQSLCSPNQQHYLARVVLHASLEPTGYRERWRIQGGNGGDCESLGRCSDDVRTQRVGLLYPCCCLKTSEAVSAVRDRFAATPRDIANSR